MLVAKERTLVCIACVVVGGLLAGCTPSTDTPAQTTGASQSPSIGAPVATQTVANPATTQPSPNVGATTAPPKASSSGTVVTQKGPKPVTKPQALRPINVAPPSAVAMIDTSRAQEGSKYSITFIPYGTGPDTGSGPGLVIKVLKSEPAAGTKKPYEFTGRNVVADSSLIADSPAVSQGGTYVGTLTLIESQGLLVPQLSDVSAQ